MGPSFCRLNSQDLVKFTGKQADEICVIEGGQPGASALYHAGQRRATADRLALEANWLETIAADQRALREVLSRLPAAYSILHDLNVPGSKGAIDHLVIGPGGAFVVVSRRYDEHIDYRDGELWAGDRSMRSVLDGVRVESQLLTQTLGTAVVPVLALLDSLLPAATPSAVDGVVVAADDNLVRVITRAAHTLLSPDKVADIAGRAVPMLYTPGTVGRAESLPGAQVVPPPATPIRLPEAEPSTAWAAAAKKRAAVVEDVAPPSPTPRRERSGRNRSAWKIGAIIVGLCAVAVAAGTLGRLVWNNDETPATTVPIGTPAPTTVGPTSSAVPSTVVTSSSVLTAPLAEGVAAPIVAYTAACPVPGSGWEMVPTWPGDLADLAEYDVEMLIADAWVSLTKWSTAAEPNSATLHGQPPNASYTLRMTAVMTDGSRSANTPTPIAAPASSC